MKTTISGTASISNAGNSTYIIYALDVTCADGYAMPVDVYTSSDGKVWKYKDYLQSTSVSISVGDADLYVQVGPATEVTSASLSVVYSSPLTAVYLGGTKYTSGFTYSGNIKFTGLEFAPGSNWSGTVYWGKSSGATTYTIATVSSGVVTMASSQESIDYTGSNRTIYVTLVSQYKVTLKRGSGISSVSFCVNATSGTTYTINSSSTSSTQDVKGSSGYLYITSVSYANGYTYPVLSTDQTTTPWADAETVINESGSYTNKRYIYGPSNAGTTRTVNLSATLAPTRYYYQIKAHGVDGTFSDGSTYWLSAVLSTAGNGGWVSYPASNIPTPTRTGYTFKGWSVSATSTAVVTSIEFTATSESSSSPTAKEVWAVWERSTSTITLDGNGGKWDAATGRLTITKNVGDVLLFANYSSLTRAGYTLLGWSANKSATAATYAADGYVSVGAADATYYAVWQRMVIAPFYWDSEGTDAALIAKGQPVSNLTAARWNKLLAKIKEVAEAAGGSFGGANVSAGGTFYATEFNEARSGILNLSGHGTLPGTKASNDEVLAALFEGSGSLKTALNAAINYYNNS